MTSLCSRVFVSLFVLLWCYGVWMSIYWKVYVYDVVPEEGRMPITRDSNHELSLRVSSPKYGTVWPRGNNAHVLFVHCIRHRTLYTTTYPCIIVMTKRTNFNSQNAVWILQYVAYSQHHDATNMQHIDHDIESNDVFIIWVYTMYEEYMCVVPSWSDRAI